MYTVFTPVERPVWKNHKIIGYVTMSRAEADRLNASHVAQVYYGFTEEEHRLLQRGTEEELVKAGFLSY
ncbi:hypothetical protein [uncultured Dysosmobacter sp.]|uniref:hypothetical protein n=1 Tax=uncultured Dysosmobacter sp. TaxID=2591384 RepID=UPI002630F6FD|nr:hypothetical protein [uncultured Dysosmobacter sp.]